MEGKWPEKKPEGLNRETDPVKLAENELAGQWPKEAPVGSSKMSWQPRKGGGWRESRKGGGWRGKK